MTAASSREHAREMKVFLNHIYELKKGIRRMALHTMPRRFEEFAISRLQGHDISYSVQPLDNGNINLFFGRGEYIETIKTLVNKPLNKLSAEQDFILGAMLGYDISGQCERYLSRKK